MSETRTSHCAHLTQLVKLVLLCLIPFGVGLSQETRIGQRDRMGFSHPFSSVETIDEANGILDKAQTAGDWFRVGLSWAAIERDSGQFVWNNGTMPYYADSIINRPYNRDFNIILCLADTPPWARPQAFFSDSTFWRDSLNGTGPAVSHGADWGHFCGRVAARYGDRVHYYEIWNEQNTQYFFRTNGSTIDYADLLRIAADSIRAADPDSAFIISGGLMPYAHSDSDAISPKDWLDDLYAHVFPDFPERQVIINDCFDYLGYHPYAPHRVGHSYDPLYDYVDILGQPSTGRHHPEAWFLFSEDLHDIMAAHGDSAKKIWGTEYGGCLRWHSLTEEMKAERINHYVSKWMDWDFTGPLLYYNVKDYYSESTQFCDTEEWGAFSCRWRKRPVYDELLNWGSGSAEYHFGLDTLNFAYQQLDTPWALKRIRTAAAYADTIRVFLHQQSAPYTTSILDSLDFTQLPEDAPFRCLEILGVGAHLDDLAENVLISHATGSIKLRANQTLKIKDLTFQDCHGTGHSLFVTTGSVTIENCHFYENSYPQGIIGWGDTDIGEIGISTPQVIDIRHSTFSGNLIGDSLDQNADPLALINCVNGIQLNHCTFNMNLLPQGDVSVRQGVAHLSNTLFISQNAGTRASIANAWANLQIDYCLFDQDGWAPGFLASADGTGNLVLNHGESVAQVAFVDPSNHDLRLKWSSVALDAGSPGSLDFDLTRTDIGWQPEYPVQTLSGVVTAPLTEGHYEVTDNTSITGSVGAGVVLRVATEKSLTFEPREALMVQIGDLNGLRTAIVARPAPNAQSASNVEFSLGMVEDCSYELNGVLFNYPPVSDGQGTMHFKGHVNHVGANLDGRTISFQHWINVPVNDGSGRVVDGGVLFDAMIGSLRHLPVGSAPGPGTLAILDSDLDVEQCTFRATGTPTVQYTSPLQVFGTLGAGTPLLSRNLFLGDTAQAAGPLAKLEHTVQRLERNRFLNCWTTPLKETHATLNMRDEARNDFVANVDFTPDSSLLSLQGGNLDLYCGRNSFIVADYRDTWPIVSWSPFPGDNPVPHIWRQNFWGTSCSSWIEDSTLNNRDMGLIPSWATTEASLLQCVDQQGPDNPACPFEPYTSYELLENGKLAEEALDYSLARDDYRFLLALYAASKEANEGTLRLKGLGLHKEYGPDNYSLVAGDLFAAADSSEHVSLHLQAVLQDCSAWCVEAYWGDREGAKVALYAMLAIETDKVCRDTINRALLEIETYPAQGGTLAASPEVRVQRHLAQQRAVHTLLNYRGGEVLSQAEVSPHPTRFELQTPYPNPFNPATTLTLALPREGQVRVRVYNLWGQQVAEPLNAQRPAGLHRVRVDGSRWASGVYVAVAEFSGQSHVQKLLLLK